jgi:hypothetical protein
MEENGEFESLIICEWSAINSIPYYTTDSTHEGKWKGGITLFKLLDHFPCRPFIFQLPSAFAVYSANYTTTTTVQLHNPLGLRDINTYVLLVGRCCQKC